MELLEQLLGRPKWHDEALCSGRSALFFAPKNERPTARDLRTAAARAMCAACPSQAPCHDAGQAEPYGIWGGSDEAERWAAGTAPRVDSKAHRAAVSRGLTIVKTAPGPKRVERHGEPTYYKTCRAHNGGQACEPCRLSYRAYRRALDAPRVSHKRQVAS